MVGTWPLNAAVEMVNAWTPQRGLGRGRRALDKLGESQQLKGPPGVTLFGAHQAWSQGRTQKGLF